MRLATITNWAYGATVALTLVSGATMLFATSAHEREREAVQQRYLLDTSTADLGNEIYALTDYARQYVVTGNPLYEVAYTREAKLLGPVEQRIAHIDKAGAAAAELKTLTAAIRSADTLQDQQRQAFAAHRRGDVRHAHLLLFDSEYERQLERSENLLERFRVQVDRRTAETVKDATAIARVWTGVSQVVLAITALLFLCVLFFVFKQRVLHPVIKLSDVVNRLAANDYAVEPPEVARIHEIGDIAQAVRVFRENGLERQRLEAERDRDSALRNLLSRMTQRMQACDDLDALMQVVTCFMPEIAPDHGGRLYLLDKERNAMVEACTWLGPNLSTSEFSPLACWALRRGEPHRPHGQAIDVPCEHLQADGGTSADTVCLPLISQREMLGLLYLESRGVADQATELSSVYLRLLAENIGLALGNLRLREALHELAMADSLTGLANRRRLDESLDRETRLAERLGAPLAALMIDVDHFKRFNDTFGHEAGDLVLREIGAVLKGVTRGGDLAFRYGGEEFLLLLPGMHAKQALERAEKIRERIAALRLSHGEHTLGQITVSVGVASATESGAYSILVPLADGALYHAKQNGRNRVEVAGAAADADTRAAAQG